LLAELQLPSHQVEQIEDPALKRAQPKEEKEKPQEEMGYLI
jgi:hypothetical protein